MLIIILSILGGLLLLTIGAESLVRGSASVALRVGVTPLAVGLTVVAFGTGSPELFVSAQAAYAGNSDIALGNIVGSNISNIALILGLSALIRPIKTRAQVIQREIPLMIAATLLLCVFLIGGVIGRFEGLILLAGGVAYTAFTYFMARREHNRRVEQEFTDVVPPSTRALWADLLLIVAGLGVLIAGAQLLVRGAIELAEGFAISQIVIGLTIVAIGTSLPELATSMVAAARKEGDIAVGNVVGSNVLNILCVLGIAALIQPIRL